MGDQVEGDGGSDTRPVGTRRLHSSESRHDLRGKVGRRGELDSLIFIGFRFF